MPSSGVLRHPVTFCLLRHARIETKLFGAIYGQPMRPFHATQHQERSNAMSHDHKIASRAVFDAKKIQRTMNKVMGVRTPINKVAYKPSLIKKTYGATVSKQEFQMVAGKI